MQEFNKWHYVIIYSAIFFLRTDLDIARHYFSMFLVFLKTGDFARVLGIYDYSGFPLQLSVTRTLVFFHFFLFTYFFISKKTNKIFRVFGVSFLLGFSIYVHAYNALLLYGAVALIILLEFLSKEIRWKGNLIALVSSFLFTIPFLINTFLVGQTMDKAEMSFKYVLYFMPSLIVPPLFTTLLLLACLLILFYSKRSREFKNYFIALIISGFLVINSHIITRYLPQPNNFFRIVYSICLPLFLIIFFNDYLPEKKVKIYIPLFTICLVAVLVITYFFSSSLLIQKSAIDPAFSEVVDWLKEKTTKEDVLLADYSLQEELLLWTPVNLYFCHPFQNSLDYKENILRIVEGYRLLNKENEEINSQLDLLLQLNRQKPNIFGRLVSQPLIEFPEQDYSIVLKNIEKIREDVFKEKDTAPHYKLDYVLIRKGVDVSSEFLKTEIIFENEKYLILKIKK